MSNCSDCSDNRLFTLSVSPVTGLTADQPAAAPTADIAIRTRDQADEDQDWIGQGVAQPLHAVQKAIALLPRLRGSAPW